MMCWFSLETSELPHPSWFFSLFFQEHEGWVGMGDWGQKGGWWCLTESHLSVCLTQTIKPHKPGLKTSVNWGRDVSASDKKQNKKLEGRVWRGKSNKEQICSLHVTKCTLPGSLICILVRRNKNPSSTVLKGVRELDPAMSIWLFGSL